MSGRDLEPDTLFVACTRPAMIHGVPLEAFVVTGMGSMLVFMVAGNPFWLVLGVPIHLACQMACRHDYNIFRLISLWAKTKGRSLNKDVWGGSSVSPLPLLPARKPHEVRIHA